MRWTLYGILHIEPSASQEEVESRCRALLQRLHPDRSRTDATRGLFALVVHAQTVLGDPDRRARYDEDLRCRAEPAATKASAPNGLSRLADVALGALANWLDERGGAR